MKKQINYEKYYVYHEELKYRIRARLTMLVIGLAIAMVALAIAIKTGEFIATGLTIGMGLTVAWFALFTDLGNPLVEEDQIGYHGRARTMKKRG